ncbi:glycosyltransferase family 4 protein [Alphaproteobacteria bacterium]|nr:glycosyltransferase family 4 protein [Alphaproteobacteria bacterium]
MKILHLIFTSTDYKVSGAVTAAKNLAIEVNKSVEAKVLIMSDKSSKKTERKLPIYEIKASQGFLGFSFIPIKLRKLFSKSNFETHIKTENPDIVHFHNPIPPLALYEIAKWCKFNQFKYVITSHGFNEIINFRKAFGINWIYSLLIEYLITRPIKFVIKNAECVFLLSEHEVVDVNSFLKSSHFNYCITPNGYPDELVNIKIKESDKLKYIFYDKTKVILFLGNHTKNKGIDTLLQTTELLTCDVKIVIAGKIRNDTNYKMFLKHIKRSSLSNVIFTNFLSEQEKYYLLSKCDLLVHPTRADTLPLSIIEAMYFAKPVVSSNIGGIPSLVDEETGILVDPGQPQLLAKAINNIIDNPGKAREMGKKGREKILKTFSWPKTASKTLQAYKDILG